MIETWHVGGVTRTRKRLISCVHDEAHFILGITNEPLVFIITEALRYKANQSMMTFLVKTYHH